MRVSQDQGTRYELPVEPATLAADNEVGSAAMVYRLMFCFCFAASPSPHHRPAAQYHQLLGQIHVDLAPWQDSGITVDMVERSYCTNFEESFRFQVQSLAAN